ncbi:MAG: hypothetical protein JWQ46_484, partial [Phenylobacterium sp.]|nr:hypothetical protein [Phenylobacterium sp.]
MRTFLLAVSLGALCVGAATAAPTTKPYLAAAMADPARAADREIDARRHPAELIAFAGVRPGDRVVDLIPGSGYFTRIFAKVVGPKGHVYMIWPDEYAKEAQPDPEKNKDLAKAYGNV